MILELFQHVRASTKEICTCTGVFTSCSHHTCWRRVADLPAISGRLVRRFDKATKLEAGNESPLLSRTGGSRKRRELKPHKKDLVYLEDSPDFCKTHFSGRKCTEDTRDPLRCEATCCHGYYRRNETELYHCRCVLSGSCFTMSNCEVKCETCARLVWNSYCL